MKKTTLSILLLLGLLIQGRATNYYFSSGGSDSRTALSSVLQDSNCDDNETPW